MPSSGMTASFEAVIPANADRSRILITTSIPTLILPPAQEARQVRTTTVTFRTHSASIPQVAWPVTAAVDRPIPAPSRESREYLRHITHLPVTATTSKAPLLATKSVLEPTQPRLTFTSFTTHPTPYPPPDSRLTKPMYTTPLAIAQHHRTLPTHELLSTLEDIERRHRTETWVRSQSPSIVNVPVSSLPAPVSTSRQYVMAQDPTPRLQTAPHQPYDDPTLFMQLQEVINRQSQAIEALTKRLEEVEVKSVADVRSIRNTPQEGKLSLLTHQHETLQASHTVDHGQIRPKEAIPSNSLPSVSLPTLSYSLPAPPPAAEVQNIPTPSTTSVEKAKKAMKMTDPFNGDADVLSYLTQFASCADHNGWDDREKAAHLTALLKDPTLQVLSMDPTAPRPTHNKLCEKLISRFGPARETALHVQALTSRRRKENETVKELVAWFEREERLAYPTLKMEQLESVLVEPFVMALNNVAEQRYIRTEAPATLSKAAKKAKAWENARSTDNVPAPTPTPITKRVRAVTQSDDEVHDASQPKKIPSSPPSPRTTRGRSKERKPQDAPVRAVTQAETDMLSALKAATQAMTAAAAAMQTRQPPSGTQRPQRSPTPSGGCFLCGDTNHWRSECPLQRATNSEYNRRPVTPLMNIPMRSQENFRGCGLQGPAAGHQ